MKQWDLFLGPSATPVDYMNVWRPYALAHFLLPLDMKVKCELLEIA